MARCPVCESDITHVETELLDLRGYEAAMDEFGQEMEAVEAEGKAIATVCPECRGILSL